MISTAVAVTAPAPGASRERPVRADANGSDLPVTGNKSPPRKTEAPVDPAEAIRQIQSYLASSNRSLQFQLDAASGRTVIRVLNPETKEIVRQIPSEEVLKLAAAMRETLGGLLNELA
jgi:flagellar protein FlaG